MADDRLDNHTPGPWHVYQPFEGDRPMDELWIERARGITVAIVPPTLGAGDHRANAHLMAAAPKMLAALEGLLAYYVPQDDHGIWAEARTAVAEARGEKT